ncbi:hypothetical protein HanRHA438_Chr00c60g0860021 [Helianthus annuus]|nr:hypothetical protein HanRHA438_Chr00c60g0860021 [Helianthus annuus]
MWQSLCLLKLGFLIGYFWGFCEEDSKDAIEVVYESVRVGFREFPCNGLEILKISNGARSLDGVNGVENLGIRQAKMSKKIGVVIAAVLGAAVVLGLLGLCYCCVSHDISNVLAMTVDVFIRGNHEGNCVRH